MIASKDQFILHYICINKILLTNHAHTMSPIPRWGVSSRVPQVHSQDEPTFHIFYFQKPHEGHLISRRLNFWRCNFCFPCSKSRIVRLEFGHSGPHKPVEPKVVIFHSFQNVIEFDSSVFKTGLHKPVGQQLLAQQWHRCQSSPCFALSSILRIFVKSCCRACCRHWPADDLSLFAITMLWFSINLGGGIYREVKLGKEWGLKSWWDQASFLDGFNRKKSCNSLIDHPNMFTTQYATDTKVRNA